MQEKELWDTYRSKLTDHAFADLLGFYETAIRKLANGMANGYWANTDYCFTKDDIECEVRRGFANAIPLWQEGFGTKFTTYATTGARFKVRDFLRQSHPLTANERKEGMSVCSLDSPVPVRMRGKNNLFPICFSNLLMAEPGDAFFETEDSKNAFWRKVHYCLRKVPNDRLVISLIYREGWTIDECAKYLGIAYGTVFAKQKRAFEILRESPQFLKLMAGDAEAFSVIPEKYGDTFKILNHNKLCVTEHCNSAPYRRGRCWQCWRDRYAPKQASSPWSGPPGQMMEQMLSRRHDDCSLPLFWQKVIHTCCDNRKGRNILTLIYRENWTVAECAKFYKMNVETVEDLRDSAVMLLVNSKSFQRWITTGVKQEFTTQYENKEWHIPVQGYVCASMGCDSPVFCKGRCRSCYRTKYVMVAVGEQEHCKEHKCDRRIYCRGYCQPHYQVLMRQGFFLPDNSPRCSCGKKMSKGRDRCSYCVNLEKVNKHRIEKMKDPAYKASIRDMQKKYIQTHPDKVKESNRRSVQRAKLKQKIIILPLPVEMPCASTG